MIRIVRLTDEQSVIQVDAELTPRQIEEVQRLWAEWWTGGQTHPLVVSGHEVEFVDRRRPDCDERLTRIEQALGITADAT